MPRPKNELLRTYFETQNNKQATCKSKKCNNKVFVLHAANLERHMRIFHPNNYHSYMKEKFANYVNKSSTSGTFKLSCTVSKKQIQTALIELFTKCDRPLCLAKDRPFQIIVNPILKALDIKLTENGIMKNITEFSLNLKKEITEELCERFISLKIDVATKLNVSVVGVHVQFISNSSIIIKTLAIKQLTHQHTSCDIKSLILEALTTYDINLNRVITITIDNGANFITDVDDLNGDCNETDLVHLDSDFSIDCSIPNIRCGGHILQFCVMNVIKSTNIAETLDIIRTCVKTLRTQSQLNMPILDNNNNWYSTYLMLEKLLEFKAVIKTVNISFGVSNEIWNFVADFLTAFKIVYTTSKKLQTENLIYSDLYIEITNITLQLEILPKSDLILCLIESLNIQKTILLENDLFVTAVFLDPRIKVCLSPDQCAQAKSCLRQLYKRLLTLKENYAYNQMTIKSEYEMNESTTSSASFAATLVATGSIDDALDEYFKSFEQDSDNKDITTSSQQIEEDIFAYERQSRLGIKDNIIDFWSKQNNQLTELAHLVLGVPCTQLSVERLFSALKYILADDQRNKLSSTDLEHILLIKSNAHFVYD